jgi:gluconokinase
MIVVVMGVAGSGKTVVGKALARDLRWSFLDADDFHPPGNVEKMRAGVPLTDADREPWLETLRDVLRRETNAVLACSALRAGFRERLRNGIPDVRFVYLKGDSALIEQRLRDRTGHFMKVALLPSQFDALEEPADAIELDAAEAPEDLVRKIELALKIER